jgi:hypothetical protein
MADNTNTRVGNITQFQVFQAQDNGESVDLSAAVVELNYYESILSNSVSLTATVVETGFTDRKSNGDLKNKGMIDALPIRGGEQSFIIFNDSQDTPNTLKFKNDTALYINRVRDIDPGTQKDVYYIDFTSRELFANEQCRVVKRYEGKISDSVRSILTQSTSGSVGIKTKKNVIVDETNNNYNFIGNDRKPFYTCTWLASKSIPSNAGQSGGAAGYLFYETYDGFNFRSIDSLFSQEYKKNYIYNNTAETPEGYSGKILSYNIERDIDLQNNLVLGTYSNRSLFFDFYAMDYEVRDYSVDDNQGEKIVTGGLDPINTVAEEFRTPTSRLMNHVLDIGTLPSGRSTEEQLKNWKNQPFNPTFDAPKTKVQSKMRYNQMFTIKINVVIAGDFSLRAGDLIHCDFPELTGDDNKSYNKKSGGIYMIASLCHRITSRDTFTSMTLVRDSFGRKSF